MNYSYCIVMCAIFLLYSGPKRECEKEIRSLVMPCQCYNTRICLMCIFRPCLRKCSAQGQVCINLRKSLLYDITYPILCYCQLWVVFLHCEYLNGPNFVSNMTKSILFAVHTQCLFDLLTQQTLHYPTNLFIRMSKIDYRFVHVGIT